MRHTGQARKDGLASNEQSLTAAAAVPASQQATVNSAAACGRGPTALTSRRTQIGSLERQTQSLIACGYKTTASGRDRHVTPEYSQASANMVTPSSLFTSNFRCIT